MENALAVEGGAQAELRFGRWAEPMLRTHRAGKGPGGVGVCLGLNRTEEDQACLPPLVSEGGGPHLGTQQAP